jgi:ABC-2 type transport system permease protein
MAALVRRDLALFFRDRRAVVITLAVPIALASLIGTVFGGAGDRAVTRVSLQLVDEDGSDTSRELAALLAGDPALEVVPAAAGAAREAVRRGRAATALILPPAFGEEAGRALFGAGDPPDVQLLRDPSRQAEAAVVRGVVTQHVMAAVSRRAFSPEGARAQASDALASLDGADLDPVERDRLQRLLEGVRDYYGDPSGAAPARRALTLPFVLEDEAVTSARGLTYDGYAHAFGGMAVQFVLFLALDSGVALLADRRRGIWDRLRAAPLSRATLLASRAASGALLALVVLTAVFAFGAVVFGVRVRGSVTGFAAVVAATALMASSFGLLVAALGRTPEATRGLAIFAALVLTMLGGAWFPAFLFPPWMQKATLAVPTRWAMDGLDAMTWRGLGLDAAVGPVAVLLGFAVLFGAVAYARFGWE